MSQHICRACSKTLDLSSFYMSHGRPDLDCKDCRNAAANKRRRAAAASRPAGKSGRPFSPNRGIILALASRPEGCTREQAQEATGATLGSMAGLMFDMAVAGLLFRPSSQSRSKQLFATQELADAFAARPRVRVLVSKAKPASEHKKPGVKPGTPQPHVAARMAELHAGTRAAKAAGLAGKAVSPHWRDKPAPGSKPVFSGETKVTVYPTIVDTRFAPKPGERVWGCGFASLRMGQYIAPAASAAARAVGA